MKSADLIAMVQPGSYDDDRLLKLHSAAHAGISMKDAFKLLKVRSTGYPPLPLLQATTGISVRTLQRKRKTNAPLSPAEGSNLVDGLRLIDRAAAVFGNYDRAMAWMQRSIRTLGGQRPIDLLSTSLGRRAVDQTLGRIEHGIVG